MAVDIGALASQAASTGQQMLTDDNNKAADAHNNYNTYQAQADAANKNVQDYTTYMQGAGSAGNQFHGEFDKELGALGYNPDEMTTARNNLNSSTGALSAYSDFANTAASKWGLNAGGFAAANAGALGNLNNNIASNQNVVNGLSDIYKTAQTGANNFTGQVIQGQHETLGGLQSVFANAASQRDSAASMMNFYDNLASQQGGLNAKQQSDYAAAQSAYAAAQAAIAQAGLFASQSALARQQYDHQAQLYATPAGPSQDQSNSMYAMMNHAAASAHAAQPTRPSQPISSWLNLSNIGSTLGKINPQQDARNWISNIVYGHH